MSQIFSFFPRGVVFTKHVKISSPPYGILVILGYLLFPYSYPTSQKTTEVWQKSNVTKLVSLNLYHQFHAMKFVSPVSCYDAQVCCGHEQPLEGTLGTRREQKIVTLIGPPRD